MSLIENKLIFLKECSSLQYIKKSETMDSLGQFFDAVQTSHNEIRKLLNGHSLQVSIEFENKNKPISDEDFKPIVQKLREKIPNIVDDLYIHYGRKLDDLKMPLMRIFDHNHKFIKSSTFLTHCAKSNLISKEDINEVNKCQSKLGELWKRYSTSSGQLTTEISTQTIDFLRIGTFGPDDNSCFRYSGGSAFTRHIIGESPNTYVVKFYEKDKVVARMLGVLTNKNVMNFFNLYMNKGVSEGNLIESLITSYATIFNVNEEDVKQYREKFDIHEDIYLNDYETISLTTKKILPRQIL